MIAIFKSNQPLTAVLFPVLVLVFGLAYFISGSVQEVSDFGLFGTAASLDRTVGILITSLVLAFNAYMLNTLFNQNDFLERNTYVIGLIYLIGCFVMPIYENPDLVLFHFFDILSFRQLFNIRQNEDARRYIFNGSLLLGIGLLFFPHAFPVLLFPFFTLLIIRPFVWREYFLALIGLLIPFSYLLFYNHFFLKTTDVLSLFWKNDFEFNLKWMSLTLFLTWTFLLVFSFFVLNRKVKRSGVRFKRLIMLSWVSIFLLIISEIIHFLNQKEYLMISQVGTTIIVGGGISISRFPFVYNTILYFLLFLGVLIQIWFN
jgi:hypothetical protein